MTPRLAAPALALLAVVGGFIDHSMGDPTTTIASETLPQATASTVPDSPGAASPGVQESGTETSEPSIGTSAWSDEQAATVTHTADRLGQVAVGLPPVPPPQPGLHGLPFAPAHLTGCDEMQFYRIQAGLPEHFDVVGYRESRCQNDVHNSCCFGYWQLHKSFWVPMPECGIASVDDLLGVDPLDKQRNACAALVVYIEQGGHAWTTW